MLHPYELSANIIINPKVNQILHYLIDLGWVQATVQEWGNACWSCSVNPIEIHKKGKPGDQVLIETWKDMKPSKQLQPRLKVPYTIILAPSMAIKVLSITSWSISLGKKPSLRILKIFKAHTQLHRIHPMPCELPEDLYSLFWHYNSSKLCTS